MVFQGRLGLYIEVIEYKQMQQALPEGFEQTEEDHLTSKQREKGRETSLYFKIPQANPLLSKQYIDNAKPKVLIRQVRISRECAELTNSVIAASSSGGVVLRRQQGRVGLGESSLWKRYLLNNNYNWHYAKFIGMDASEMERKKWRTQLMKMTLNREHLFATYIMDINFLSDGAPSAIRNLEEASLDADELALSAITKDYQFDSRFQCSNLMYVLERCEQGTTVRQFHLILQNDINTKGFGNWFYFKFLCKRPGKYRFIIPNAQKNYSFFSHGMRPAAFSLRKHQQQQTHWQYAGQNVTYTRNDLIKDETTKQRYNTLTWTYEQTEESDVVYFAAGVPYSYSKLMAFIENMERSAKNNGNLYFRRETLAATISGNECPLLTITWKRDRREQPRSKKRIVMVLARQHPSEVVSSFVMQGLVKHLVQLQGGEASVELLKRYIFKIIPMGNIDGVIYGNSRCDITGADPNRKWTKSPHQPLYPLIAAVKKMVASLVCEGYEIEYFLDLHGHSRKLGSFIYACKNYDEVETRMFAWIMSKINERFSFQNCRFGLSNFRRETARGYMMGIAANRKAMTLETSFFGYRHSSGLKQFDVADLHAIGGSLAEAIHIDTFRSSKAINWATARADIKATIHSRPEEQENSSGSDSNPEVDQLNVKEKMETFLAPPAAGKLGLIDIRVVEKARREEARERESREGLLDHEPYSSHEIFNQNFDTVLNQKYLQSTTLTKTEKFTSGMRETKSVTRMKPFRFNSLEKKPLSLAKKIKIAIDVERIEKREQKLATPSLPSVLQKNNARQFWSNLKKQYESLVNQKKSLLKGEGSHWARP